jgi:hypothetical protein
MKKTIFFVLLLSAPMFINAQKSNGLDLSVIRNFNTKLNGVNGSFEHRYSEHWAVALDLSLFPSGSNTESSITTKTSAIDISCKAYYKMPISKYWEIFPILGVSHTWEKETETVFGPTTLITESKENYFSVLPGIGIKAKNSKFAPFAEFIYSTGTENQPIIFVGLSHELK